MRHLKVLLVLSPQKGYDCIVRPGVGSLASSHGSCLQSAERSRVEVMNMVLCRPFSIFVCTSLLLASFCSSLPANDEERRIEWQPIDREELALKDNPAVPGASAMILYREVLEDDSRSYEIHHDRIKIFTDDGKKYADVEITFLAGRNEVVEIQGRTIRPDGSVVDFQGQVLEKTVVRARKPASTNVTEE